MCYNMAKDVDKVLRTCMQCWRRDRNITKKIPLGTLPRGWPGEIVASDLFGPLPRTKNGNVFILVNIVHYSIWVKIIALKKAGVSKIVLALRDI